MATYVVSIVVLEDAVLDDDCAIAGVYRSTILRIGDFAVSQDADPLHASIRFQSVNVLGERS